MREKILVILDFSLEKLGVTNVLITALFAIMFSNVSNALLDTELKKCNTVVNKSKLALRSVVME